MVVDDTKIMNSKGQLVYYFSGHITIWLFFPTFYKLLYFLSFYELSLKFICVFNSSFYMLQSY